jgi:hypothetical protein
MAADIILLYDLFISSQFAYMFSSSAFLHSCYRYRLTMDESKSKTNVRCCVECAVVRYIFHAMYVKKYCLMKWLIKVFQLMELGV